FRWIHGIFMPPILVAASREQFRRGILLSRSPRKKPANNVAFPHPQPRKEQDRKNDIANREGVVWSIRRRIINVTEYRNAKDNVNPAKNRTFSRFFHDSFSFFSEITTPGSRYQNSRLLSRLRRPVGRFRTELLGVFGDQAVPAAGFHGVTTGQAADGSSAEKA